MIWRTAIAVALFCAAASPAPASMVEFEGRYWMPDLDAQASVRGSEVDLQSDLGVGDEDFPEGRLTWNTGPDSRITFSYTRTDFSGDRTLTRAIQYQGQTYTAGARAVSDFDLDYGGAVWAWQFLDLFETVKLGPVAGIKAARADLSLDAPSLNIREDEDFLGAAPVAGAALDVSLVKILNIFAEVSGMAAGGYGHIIDAEAGVKVIPVDSLVLSAGYRVIDFSLEDGHDFADVRLQGPFAALSLRF